MRRWYYLCVSRCVDGTSYKSTLPRPEAPKLGSVNMNNRGMQVQRQGICEEVYISHNLFQTTEIETPLRNIGPENLNERTESIMDNRFKFGKTTLTISKNPSKINGFFNVQDVVDVKDG